MLRCEFMKLHATEGLRYHFPCSNTFIIWPKKIEYVIFRQLLYMLQSSNGKKKASTFQNLKAICLWVTQFIMKMQDNSCNLIFPISESTKKSLGLEART